MKYAKFALPTILMIGLLGCGSDPTPPTEATETPETTQSEATTSESSVAESSIPADAPTYKIAMSGKQPPFNFMDEYGNFQGIDVDIMRKVGEIEGFHVEFVKVPFADIFQTIDDGINDVLFGGLSYSEERDMKYAVSDSYLFVPSAFMYTNPDLNLTSITDIAELTYSGVPVIQQTQDILEQNPDINFVPADTTFLAFEKLIRGEADFIAEDIQFLQYLEHEFPEYDLIISPYQTEADPRTQQIALATKENSELIEKINHGFSVLNSTNEVKNIEQKWLSQQ